LTKPSTTPTAANTAPAVKRKPNDGLEGPERKTLRRDIEGNKSGSEAGVSAKVDSEADTATKEDVKPAPKEEIKAKEAVSQSIPI
jgi:hypothetical protein